MALVCGLCGSCVAVAAVWHLCGGCVCIVLRDVAVLWRLRGDFRVSVVWRLYGLCGGCVAVVCGLYGSFMAVVWRMGSRHKHMLTHTLILAHRDK